MKTVHSKTGQTDLQLLRELETSCIHSQDDFLLSRIPTHDAYTSIMIAPTANKK